MGIFRTIELIKSGTSTAVTTLQKRDSGKIKNGMARRSYLGIGPRSVQEASIQWSDGRTPECQNPAVCHGASQRTFAHTIVNRMEKTVCSVVPIRYSSSPGSIKRPNAHNTT